MIAEPAPLRGRLPVVGHLPSLLRRPLRLLQDAQSHGDVVTIFLGSTKAYFVNQPEHLRAMLVTSPGDYDKGVHFEKAELVIGNSLPVSSGVVHRRNRKLIRPAFGQACLRGYFDVMRDCALERIGTWSPDTDAYSEIRHLVGTITARTLFSIDAAERSAAELVALVDILDAGVIRRVLDPTGFLEKLPLPSNRRFDQARARTHQLVDDIIRSYRLAGGDRPDLLSTLLAARSDDTSEGMSDGQLRDEAVAMLQAGLETTAQALRWTCHALSEHPDVQRRLQDEVDDVVSGECVTFDDLGQGCWWCARSPWRRPSATCCLPSSAAARSTP